MVDHERGAERTSRRTALKRLGGGAAVVWAAPLLTSVGARAAAGTFPACGDRCITENECFAQCGRNSASPFGNRCFCSATPEEECACFVPVCDFDFACATSDDCPEGFACAACCFGFCAPLCSTETEAPAAPRGGRAWGS